MVTNCKHTFHKDCITKWLGNSQECPNCKKLCHVRDLVSISSRSIANPKISNLRGRGRGSAAKRYDTRGSRLQDEEVSSSQALQKEIDVRSQGISQESDNPVNNLNNTQELYPNVHNSTRNTTQNSNRGRRSNFNRMSQMIESTVKRVLLDMNISSVQPQQNSQTEQIPPTLMDTQQQNQIIYNAANRFPNFQQNPERGNRSVSNNNPDKITSMIQSWNVKFLGIEFDIPALERV